MAISSPVNSNGADLDAMARLVYEVLGWHVGLYVDSAELAGLVTSGSSYWINSQGYPTRTASEPRDSSGFYKFIKNIAFDKIKVVVQIINLNEHYSISRSMS